MKLTDKIKGLSFDDLDELNSKYIDKDEFKNKINSLLFTFDNSIKGKIYQKGVIDTIHRVLELLED